MSIYSDPPSLRSFRYDKPTLLVCWWATSFCALMILLRISGRFIRTERLFLEDKIAAAALIPLFLRMICLHFVLLYGTNNADFTGMHLSPLQLHHKSVASGLVLASRFFYAATLWILKNAILEFLRRLTGLTWKRSHHITLISIRWTLFATFVAVVISDVVECRPFAHYWQVLPDPGGQCRQAYLHLITLATCNVLTDALLVLFPILVILRSHLTLRRKLQLILLFSLSLSVVAITLFRLPRIIHEHGRQQYRSLLASIELLFATASANSLVLGSFVRDRGLKKHKFRHDSLADSIVRANNLCRPTLHQLWGSDEDLVRDVGLAIEAEPRHYTASGLRTPQRPMHQSNQVDDANRLEAQRLPSSNNTLQAAASLQSCNLSSRAGSAWNPAMLSIVDNGLVRDSCLRSRSPLGRTADEGSSAPCTSGKGAVYAQGSSFSTSCVEDDAHPLSPPNASLSAPSGFLRGSSMLLQDLGGLITPPRPYSVARTHGQLLAQLGPLEPYDDESDQGPRLRDPGGLLS